MRNCPCGVITSVSLTDVGNGQAGCDRGCCKSLQERHQLKLYSCVSNWYMLCNIIFRFSLAADSFSVHCRPG
jgi:hypothetical protein